jgi:hypothetical protein
MALIVTLLFLLVFVFRNVLVFFSLLEFVPVVGLTTFEFIVGIYLSIYLKLVGCFNLFITYLSNNLSSIKLGFHSVVRSLVKGLHYLLGSSLRIGGR